jgi:hypothetical protein
MRAAIIGHAEDPGVGHAAPADFGRSLHNGDPTARRDQAPRRRDAGGTSTDNDGVDTIRARRALLLGSRLRIGSARLCQRRRSRHGSRSGKK